MITTSLVTILKAIYDITHLATHYNVTAVCALARTYECSLVTCEQSRR